MKKIISIMLCIAILTGMTSFAAFNDVATDSIYAQSISRLSGMGIITGYGDGNFGVYDKLTRSQFSKLSVMLLGETDLATSKKAPTFTDVAKTHWGVGYINQISSKGIITGYPDGSFRPDDYISYAQAITVMVRMLGFTAADVGERWPFDYIEKARDLNLLDGLNFSEDDFITRGDAAIMLDRLLFVQTKTGTRLIEQTDFKATKTGTGDSVYYSPVDTGVVLSCSNAIATYGDDKGKMEYYTKLMLGDGSIVSYKSSTNYEKLRGKLVGASFKNGLAQIEQINNSFEEGKSFSNDCVVLDLLSIPTTGDAVVQKLKFVEVPNKSKVTSVAYNSSGQIMTIFTKDVTGSNINLKEIKDSVIYGIKDVDASLSADDVVTTGGTFKIGSADVKNALGCKATLYIDDDNKIEDIVVSDQTSKVITLKSVYEDGVLAQSGESIKISDSMVAYYNGKKTNFGSVKVSLAEGSTITIYDDYIFIIEAKLVGPYTITSDYTQVGVFFGQLNNVLVVRDGEVAKITDIRAYDVVYYNEVTNRLFVYCDSVTGMYEKAMPNKSEVETVNVAGNSYTITTAAAKAKLNDSVGAFKIGDRVTLLLGKDGEVVDVVDKDSLQVSDMGVVLSTRFAAATDGDDKGKKEYYVSLMLGNGNTVEYKCDKDYDSKRGDFVKLSYADNSTITLKTVNNNSLVGSFDKSIPAYAGHDFAQNYSILELIDLPDTGEVTVKKIELKDINLASLKEEQVIHAEYANSMGDILVLYVKDVTNSNYSYGLVTSAASSSTTTKKVTGNGTEKEIVTDMSVSGSYTINVGGTEVSYKSSNYSFTVSSGMAVMFEVKNGSLSTMKSMYEVKTGSKIEDYTATKVKIDGSSYRMDENVQVFIKDDGEWRTASLDEVKGKGYSSVAIYADKPINANGKVRIIKII